MTSNAQYEPRGRTLRVGGTGGPVVIEAQLNDTSVVAAWTAGSTVLRGSIEMRFSDVLVRLYDPAEEQAARIRAFVDQLSETPHVLAFQKSYEHAHQLYEKGDQGKDDDLRDYLDAHDAFRERDEVMAWFPDELVHQPRFTPRLQSRGATVR